jgi:hypothetical protein
MRPLREEFDPTDADAVAAAALLSRVPPLEESIQRRRRVRLALMTPRRSARMFSPVLVAGIVLIAATGASATVTRFWKRSHLPPAPDRFTVESSPRPAPKPAVLEHATALPVRNEPAVAVPEPTIDPIRTAPRQSIASKGRLVARVPAPTQSNDPASGPGAALMVEAMQARKAGDAIRASALLTEYRQKYPEGAFHEEALALSIESAAARQHESARELAIEYLRRYPNGRFRDLAQRVLRGAR